MIINTTFNIGDRVVHAQYPNNEYAVIVGIQFKHGVAQYLLDWTYRGEPEVWDEEYPVDLMDKLYVLAPRVTIVTREHVVEHKYKVGDMVNGSHIVARIDIYPHPEVSNGDRAEWLYENRRGDGVYVYEDDRGFDFIETIDAR